MNREELSAWLRLTQTEAIGPVGARRLLSAFGLPQYIFSASYAELVRQVDEALARAVTATPAATLNTLIESTEQWLAGSERRHFVTLADTAYPSTLLSMPDPPTVLYIVGDPLSLTREGVAIVGSRNATAAGIKNAQAFAASFAQHGLAVISGLALGIDGAAHQGALEAGGLTIAVTATGPDVIYPAKHKTLAHRLLDAGGVIVTEYAVGSAALPHQFPRRNRIIAGLSRGVLVVEAAIHSGSLITARLAAEQGREVFAIPGSIHSPQAKGCHRLIKEGAKLVECAEDVFAELRWQPSTVSNPTPSAAIIEDDWLAQAGFDPFTLDELAARTAAPLAELSVRLTDWELAGWISPLPGGRWQRSA